MDKRPTVVEEFKVKFHKMVVGTTKNMWLFQVLLCWLK